MKDLTISDVYVEASKLHCAMSQSIAQEILNNSSTKEDVRSAITEYQVVCDECGEEYSLDSVRCKEDGSVVCDNCGG